MSFEIFRSDEFTVALKKLAKRHKSLADDYARFLEDLKQNPFQGVEIAPNIRKVRLAISSKGRGKSGGARVITYNRLTTLLPYHLTTLPAYFGLYALLSLCPAIPYYL